MEFLLWSRKFDLVVHSSEVSLPSALFPSSTTQLFGQKWIQDAEQVLKPEMTKTNLLTGSYHVSFLSLIGRTWVVTGGCWMSRFIDTSCLVNCTMNKTSSCLFFMDHQERNFWNLFIFSWLSILKHFVATELKVLNLNNFDDFWFCVTLFFRSPESNIFEHVLTSMSSERKGNIDLNTGLVLDYTLGFWTFC